MILLNKFICYRELCRSFQAEADGSSHIRQAGRQFDNSVEVDGPIPPLRAAGLAQRWAKAPFPCSLRQAQNLLDITEK